MEVNEGDLTESLSKVIYKEAVKNDCDGLESLRQKIQIARFYFCRQSPRGARVVPERDGVRIYAMIQNRSETKEIMDGRFLSPTLFKTIAHSTFVFNFSSL